MNGLMMDRPLLISAIAEHAARFHADREIVSITADDPRHRTSWGAVVGRARQLANALGRLGLERGDRVATLAWNDHRHLELYYGISGAGYVCHTINPRLFPEQLAFIINHAGDRWLFVARVEFGGKDVAVPIPLDVKWAGDTPVITLTDLTIPGLGTYTARVLIFRDHYAGTWSGGGHGGHLWGRIERPEDAENADVAGDADDQRADQ